MKLLAVTWNATESCAMCGTSNRFGGLEDGARGVRSATLRRQDRVAARGIQETNACRRTVTGHRCGEKVQTRTTGSIAAVAACAAMLSPAVASAEESDWRVKAEAGLVAARGNTNTDTANAKLELGREFETWTHGIALSGIYASDEKGATAQRW
ncbi:MAG: hypothetical protein DIU71_13225, partial [Proteobacteria bacterium]